MSAKTDSPYTWQNLLLIILTVLSIAVLFRGDSITKINWGINQLSFLPSSLYYILLAHAVGALVLLFLKPRKHYLSVFLVPYLWGEKKRYGRLIILLLALAVFLIFRFEAHLYGDSYIRLAHLSQFSSSIFPWYEFGSSAIPYFFYFILKTIGVDKLTAAIWAYQIVSIVSGLVFLYYVIKISEIAFDKNDNRITFLLLILFSGLNLFSFGMVENQPILLSVLMITVYYVFRLIYDYEIENLRYIWGLSILGIILNFQFIIVLPMNLYLTFKYLGRNERTGGIIGSVLALIFPIVVIVLLYFKAADDIGVANRILFLSGKQPDVDYALFSLHHLTDILNLFYLFIPLFLLLGLAILFGFKKLRDDRIYITLGFLTAAQFICMTIIDPKNGMARDINMYGMLLVGFLFWGVYSLLKIKSRFRLSKNSIIALCPIALLIITPGYIVHLSPSLTEKSLERFLSYNETKYESALLAFRDYYYANGNIEKSERFETSIIGKTPGALQSKLVDDLYMQEQYSDAFNNINILIERYPYNAGYRTQRANIQKFFGRYNKAEEDFKTALALKPYNPDIYHFLSELYREQRLEKKCHNILLKAEHFAGNNVIILTDLMGYYYRTGKYIEVNNLTNRILQIDPDMPYPFMYSGLIAEKMHQHKKALALYERFIELNDKLPEVPQIRKRINTIYLMQSDSVTQE